MLTFKFFKKPKNWLKLFVLLTLLGVAFGVLSGYAVKQSAKGKIYSDSSKIKKNRVGLVLGTSKYTLRGTVNLFYKFRVDAAVRLYKKGKVDFILVSGDNGSKNYDEPTAFKNDLIKRGVPKNKIFLDYAGFRTLDSIVRAKEVFGLNKFTIISQEFHNERALFIASQKGIDAIAYNAKNVTTRRYKIKTFIREYFARGKAVIDVLFGVKPKFLGGRIHIK